MLTLLVLAAAAAAPQPGEIKTFRDWIVGCDNGRACQAVGLLSDGEDMGATVTVERDAAALAVPRITITSEAEGVAALAIDDARLAFRLRSRDGVLEILPADATDLAVPLAKANRMALIDARGKTLARISLAGASAALRWMDDRQQRAGTVTALVAKGTKPASAVPPPPALPFVMSSEESGAPVPKIADAAAIRAAKLDLSCGSENRPIVTKWRLDAAATVVLVSSPCDSGAYNFGSAVVLADNKGTLRRVDPPGAADSNGLIVNGDWDPQTRSLTSYNKGRGIGDCGVAREWSWTGTAFALTDEKSMPECRGSADWIRTFRARTR